MLPRQAYTTTQEVGAYFVEEGVERSHAVLHQQFQSVVELQARRKIRHTCHVGSRTWRYYTNQLTALTAAAKAKFKKYLPIDDKHTLT